MDDSTMPLFKASDIANGHAPSRADSLLAIWVGTAVGMVGIVMGVYSVRGDGTAVTLAVSVVVALCGVGLVAVGFLAQSQAATATSFVQGVDRGTDGSKSPSPSVSTELVPNSVLALGAGGILLVVGSFLPWVTVSGLFDISGASAHWGLVTLVAGLVAAAIAVQLGTGRLTRKSADHGLATVALLLGVISLAISIYVGFAIRDSVAEAKSDSEGTSQGATGDPNIDESLNKVAKSFEDLFKVGTGVGVYITMVGGLAVAGGSGMSLRTKRRG